MRPEPVNHELYVPTFFTSAATMLIAHKVAHVIHSHIFYLTLDIRHNR